MPFEPRLRCDVTGIRKSQCSTTTATTTTTTPPEPEIVLGDVNGDGKVDSVDASKILKEYARVSTGYGSILDERQKAAADVDGSGRVDSIDASNVLAFYSYISGGGTITDMKEWLK